MLFLLQLYKLNTDFHFLTLLFPLFTIHSFEKHWSSCSNDSERADIAPLSLQVTGAVLTSDEAVGMTHTMCQPCLLKLALLREISFHSSRTAASSTWNTLLTLSLLARENPFPYSSNKRPGKESCWVKWLTWVMCQLPSKQCDQGYGICDGLTLITAHPCNESEPTA